MKKLILFVVVLFLFCSVSAFATPLFDQINFKTRTTLLPGTYSLRFSLWDASAKGGTMVWSETQTVAVSGNIIDVDLGVVTPLPDIDYNLPWYVQVDNAGRPVSKTREKLNISQYSLWSLESTSGSTGFDADTVDGQHASAFAASSHSHSGSNITAGTIDTARLSVGTTAGTVAAGDHNHSGIYADLTNTQTVGGAKTFSSQIASSVATGTAPLQVASTTMVSNLNAEMIGGKKLVDLDNRYNGTALSLNRMTTLTTLDPAGDTGQYTSITIGTDGFPIISYRDGDMTTGVLKIIHCSNASCSASDNPVTLDSTAGVGAYNSITIGTDGFPILSYKDGPNGDLKVVHCTNTSCSASDTPVTLDSAGDVGTYSSIIIGTDGFPVISYADTTNQDLKIVHCTNASCSTYDTPVTLDSTGNVGSYTSITIGTDGFPIISYYDNTNGDLKVVHCTNASCSTYDTPVTLDSTGNVGLHTSITIGTDGYPIISYAYSSSLKAIHCTNTSCSANDAPSTLDASIAVKYTSITIGTDGYPIISYYDVPNANLKVVRCTNTACSANDTPIILDSTGDVGQYTSITIGTDGFPIISYRDVTNGNLKVAKCANQYCRNWWRR